MTEQNVPTTDSCERIFYAALEAGDAQGVYSALMLMAPQDPHRAQRLVDALRFALATRQQLQTGDPAAATTTVGLVASPAAYRAAPKGTTPGHPVKAGAGYDCTRSGGPDDQ